MKPGLCPLCGSRKARRACPALHQEIGAFCCGTKRLTEIRCPPACGYLQSARNHPAAAVRRRDEREFRLFATVLHGTSEKQRAIFAFLQTVIARHAATAIPKLVDKDVVDAAGALAATFETASRGIIYEQQPASLPGQRLAADMRQQIEQTLHASERPVDRDLAVALRRTETMATHAATELDEGPTAYLEFLERKIGKDEVRRENTPEQPSNLIIPG